MVGVMFIKALTYDVYGSDLRKTLRAFKQIEFKTTGVPEK